MLSTWYTTVSWLPLTIFLAKHQLYGFISSTHSCRLEVRFLQKIRAVWGVLYSSFFNSLYTRDFILYVKMYFWFSLWYNLVSISTILHSIFMCAVSSSISACMNAPGMSTVSTWQCSVASIRHVRNSDSINTVGALALSLVRYFLCFIPSAQHIPLILPHLFWFRNIRYCSDASFCLRHISLVFFDSGPFCNESDLSLSEMSLPQDTWIPLFLWTHGIE